MARLNIFGTFADNFISFAGGNPGALNTLFELQKEAKDRTALFLLTLDRMELYESHLYMLWNDCCNRDIKKVIKILELYEREIITQQDIDERIKNVGYGRNFDDLIKESEEMKMKTLEGNVIGKGLKVGIVAARFNEFIVNKLIGGAEDALVRHGVDTKDVELAYVPGAFEIPIVAQKMAASGKYDAVICLGAVIKGSTSHYDYVCAEVSKGVATVGLNTGVPTLFGVLTTDNIEQAIERAGTKAGNKGYDVACSAIEMVNLMKEL